MDVRDLLRQFIRPQWQQPADISTSSGAPLGPQAAGAPPVGPQAPVLAPGATMPQQGPPPQAQIQLMLEDQARAQKADDLHNMLFGTGIGLLGNQGGNIGSVLAQGLGGGLENVERGSLLRQRGLQGQAYAAQQLAGLLGGGTEQEKFLQPMAATDASGKPVYVQAGTHGSIRPITGFIPTITPPKAPTGYRFGDNDQLEPIPGGPADPSQISQQAGARRAPPKAPASRVAAPPSGFTRTPQGLAAIPGGPHDPAQLAAEAAARARALQGGQPPAAAPVGPPPAGPPMPTAPVGPPMPKTKAEFDALPSGTVFVAPDGSKRRKP